MNTPIFLDRDGVINENRDDYVKTLEEFVPLPGAIESIRMLSDHGYPIFVITNQSAVGRGILSPQMLADIHQHLKRWVEEQGGYITAIYVCPHTPWDNCSCRKPKTGLLEQAAADFGLHLEDAILVGDAYRDIEAGRKVRCRTILVRSGQGAQEQAAHKGHPIQPDSVVEDLREAVALILSGEAEKR